MAEQILLPKLGNSVESCVIVDWKKKEGDLIKTGDVLCEVETDKATVEVESVAEGTILKLYFEVDDEVLIHTPIAVVGNPGDDISGFSDKADSKEEDLPETAEKKIQAKPDPVSAPAAQKGGTSSAISPRARNLAASKGVDVSVINGTGPGGRIIERDIINIISEGPALSAAAIEAVLKDGKRAPAAGTGIGGRVLTSDLQDQAISSGVAPEPVQETVEEVKVKGIRKLTAKRMAESLSNTAQLTLNTKADARAILALRKKFKTSSAESGLQKITITDMVLFAAAKTLAQHPELNTHFLNDRMLRFKNVNLGCAVDTPKGLMVPVIKNAALKTLKQLSDEAKRLFSRCLEGGIQPDELSGGSFTVTNLGAMGIESFTPVLNAPEVGILGVCTIEPKPVMKNGEVSFVPFIGLSLTFDHQAVDGAPAARFLKDLVSAISNFELTLSI